MLIIKNREITEKSLSKILEKKVIYIDPYSDDYIYYVSETSDCGKIKKEKIELKILNDIIDNYNINIITDNTNAAINLKFNMTCSECQSTDFKFQTTNEELDSPYANDTFGVTGVTCNKCGFAYSLNLYL